MKIIGMFAGLALFLPLASAQPATNPATPAGSSGTPAASTRPVVTPTTAVVAIGRPAGVPDRSKFGPYMPQEIRDTLALHLAGKITTLYSLKGEPGVLFVLSVDNVEAAKALLADLPLVKAGLLEFQLLPVGPLDPMRLLLNPGQ